MEKDYYFHNVVYAETDSFGNWNEESVRLGFVNYGDKQLGRYFSFHEIDKLLKSGFKDNNIYKMDNGQYGLYQSYCSHCGCFSIHCGRVLHPTEYTNLLSYAKKIGLVHDKFIPMKGWKGTKTMEETPDGKFNVYYKINSLPEHSIGFVKKVCIGAVKKLAGKRENYYDKDKLEIKKIFECDDVIFDDETITLKIIGISLDYINSKLVEMIKRLDLELWMLFNENKEWPRFFSAAIDMVLDRGQEHWLNKEYTEDDSNYNWSDVDLGNILKK